MEYQNQNNNSDQIETSPTEKPAKWSGFRKFMLPLIAFVVLAGGGAGYYFYSQYQANQTDPPADSQKEVNALIAQVGKLIILPQNEIPTVATVSDPEKLKGQAFFINALQGDKVLIYSTAKKAILYRPSAKKIIEVAPINLGTSPTSPTLPPPTR